MANEPETRLTIPDPRVREWLFMSPAQIIGIVALYLYFCLYAGPRFMRNRQPYEIKRLLNAYNLFQIAFNLYFVKYVYDTFFVRPFNFLCEPVDYSHNEETIMIIRVCWLYMVNKFLDMIDTVFFILKKKTNHISFLHVYHHAAMAFFVWCGVMYIPGGNGIILGVLNSFVHVIMYGYYFLTSLGPNIKEYLWWKKYLTVLQIVQFVIIAVHSMVNLTQDCSYPRIANILILVNSILFIYLFGKFYVKNYSHRVKSKDA